MGQSTRLIRFTIDVVFAYLADLPRHADWAGGDLRVEPVSIETLAVGSTFRSRGHQLGFKLQDELMVVAYDPPHGFAFESRGIGGVFRHEFILKPQPDG